MDHSIVSRVTLQDVISIMYETIVLQWKKMLKKKLKKDENFLPVHNDWLCAFDNIISSKVITQ